VQLALHRRAIRGAQRRRRRRDVHRFDGDGAETPGIDVGR
jgi:hypothetical protein